MSSGKRYTQELRNYWVQQCDELQASSEHFAITNKLGALACIGGIASFFAGEMSTGLVLLSSGAATIAVEDWHYHKQLGNLLDATVHVILYEDELKKMEGE